MNNAQVSTVLKCENILGESCFWDPRYDCLVWTDIQGKKLLNLMIKTKVLNLIYRIGQALFCLEKKMVL